MSDNGTYPKDGPENSLSQVPEASSILVLGIGNRIMGDDGLGLAAIEKLSELYAIPETVDVVDGGTMGLYLIDRLCGYGKVLILDSVVVDEPPGTVIIARGDEVHTTFKTRLSPHQQGINDLIAALVLMDRKPGEIVIVGMVPRSISLTLDLSDPVSENLAKMAETAAEVLREWGVLS